MVKALLIAKAIKNYEQLSVRLYTFILNMNQAFNLKLRGTFVKQVVDNIIPASNYAQEES